MKLLFDFLPVLVFFITFKLADIYVATSLAIAASFAQCAIHYLLHRRLENMHLIGLVLITVLGGATLFFKNPLFIKWKPTAIYWATAVAFLLSRFIGQKTLIEKMMDGNIKLKTVIWQKLNVIWMLFFIFMGFLNLYIAFNFNTNTWVYFKLFGGLGLTVLFVLAQSLYLAKHLQHNEAHLKG